MARIQDNNMVIDPVKDLFPDNEIRGHSLALSMYKPRSSSISSSESKEEYHICIQRISNKMDEDDPIPENSNNQINVFQMRFWPQVLHPETTCSTYSWIMTSIKL